MRYDARKWQAQVRRPRRRGTRWLLLGGVILALGYAVARIFLPDNPNRFFGFEPWALMPIAFGIGLSPFGRDSWLSPAGLAVFDEFERDALQRASLSGYRALLVTMFLGSLWLCVAARWDWPAPHTWQQWATWAMTLTWVGAALPILFAEFIVPLPPKGDAEEDA